MPTKFGNSTKGESIRNIPRDFTVREPDPSEELGLDLGSYNGGQNVSEFPNGLSAINWF